MKKDTIKELFNKPAGTFDTEMPNTDHDIRFLEKLKLQNDSVDRVSKKTNYWKPFLAVAASVVLCISVFTFMQQHEPELLDLASVSPELSQTQSFFTLAIEQELASIEALRTPETEEMISDAMKELKGLEAAYHTLKIDLNASGNDKRVIYAMITNFQNRINILQSVLDHIEELKTYKLNKNENTTTI